MRAEERAAVASRRKKHHVQQKIQEKGNRGPGTYDTDHGLGSSLHKTVSESPRRYASAFSSTPRWPEHESVPASDVIYDVDVGPAQTLSRKVAESPRSYASVFKSKAPKGTQDPQGGVPDYYDPDAATKTSLVKGVAKSPRKYASSFASRTPRFPSSYRPEADLQYDPDTGTKQSTAAAVAFSPRKFAAVFSTTPRFKDTVAVAAPDPTTYQDGIDAGNKKSIAKSVEDSDLRYSAAFSATPRRPLFRDAQNHVDYDVRVHDVAESTRKTPRQYSIMRSQSERFPRPPQVGRGEHGNYNTDAASKSSLSKKVHESPRKFAAAFSSTPRFRETTGEYSAKFYDVDGGTKSTISTRVKKSSIGYSNVRSTAPRFRSQRRGDTADLVYDTDRGISKSLGTGVAWSSINYSSMKSTTPRFKDVRAGNPNIGPGSYDIRPPAKESKPLSSMVSKSSRSTLKMDPENHQSTGVEPGFLDRKWHGKGVSMTKSRRWGDHKEITMTAGNTIEADQRHWTSKGFFLPKTERFSEV